LSDEQHVDENFVLLLFHEDRNQAVAHFMAFENYQGVSP